MSEESNGGGCGWFGFFLFWVFPWFLTGEDGPSGGEVGLIFLWYGFLFLIGCLAALGRRAS